MIYADANEIVAERTQLGRNLEQLIENTSLETPAQKLSALRGLGAHTNFFLSYQGQNDLDLQKQYGQFVHRIMAANYPQWTKPRHEPAKEVGGKIRIGYISSCVYSHTVGIFILGWLRNLGLPDHRDEIPDFDIICYYLGEKSDNLTAEVQKCTDRFHYCPGSLESIAAKIESDDLHILIHIDNVLNATAYQLAALRLAPVQCTYWGHPVTTGLPTIDYYLSSDLMEPPNAVAHYSETLVRLPGLALNYPMPHLPADAIRRSRWDIPDNAVIFLNCQSLYKYLPQHDDVFPQIAKQVPHALFIFFSHRNAHINDIFRQRLETSFQKAGLSPCFKMLPRLDHENFLRLNMAADIFLDTFEFSGAQTTLEALACDLPVVTLPGAFMRGRQSYGFLSAIDVTETIAKDKADYIRLATALGTNTEFRTTVRNKIRYNKHRLFENHKPNAELAVFFRGIAYTTATDQITKTDKHDLQELFHSAAKLQSEGNLNAAAELYNDIINQAPDFQSAVNNLGTIYSAWKQYDKAIECYSRMVTLVPDLAQAHHNLGSAYRNNDDLENAAIHLQRAVQLKPDFAEAWNNLALTWKNLGELDKALASFDRAVALAPKLAAARWNRSFVHILKGNYEQGWRDFQWRFVIDFWQTIYPFRLRAKRWDGKARPDQTILVHDEQGLGDTLQFIRYLPMVRRNCGNVVFETRPELISLLQCASGFDQLIERSKDGCPQTRFDAYVPLMSLPFLFGTTKATIPDTVPYLFADPAKVSGWETRWKHDRPTVGLMWAGRPQHTNDRNRSVRLAQLLPILRTPGIRFIGMQKGAASNQAGELPPEIDFINIGEELLDFNDTAACLMHLDLIITVDTAVAHLAGAMGRQVWLLLPFVPDWRWGMQGDTTPWYPSMRLFRQPRRNAWEPVFQNMGEALPAHFASAIEQTGSCAK